MKVAFKKSFAKDLRKRSHEKTLLKQVKEIIQAVEEAASISGINNLKKLRAEGSYYRIRSGNYRLGLIIDGNTITFVRALHRSEIYRFFP